MTLFGQPEPGKSVTAGRKLFTDNCAVCHGDAGQGNREFGAPRLAAHIHLYGDTREQRGGARSPTRTWGVMPNWNHRLDPATIKSVTLYVHSLGGGE